MQTHLRLAGRAALAFAVLFLMAAPASAAGPMAPPVASYWSGFVDFWAGAIRNQNGVTLVALGVGIASVAVIASGKWVK
ncbi:MAG: hypothetical protein ACRC7O_10040 [Fimbriiglobus sp.]